jgi:hypothetical protein
MTLCRTLTGFTNIPVPQYVLDSQTIEYGSLYSQRAKSHFLAAFTQTDIESSSFNQLLYRGDCWYQGGPNFIHTWMSFGHTGTHKFMPMETLGYMQVSDTGKSSVVYLVKCMAFFHSRKDADLSLLIYILENSFDVELARCEDL